MKHRFALLLALCGLFSCSDGETLPNSETTPPTALFVAVNDVELLMVDVRDGQCHQFTVWQSDGSRFYAQGFSTSGKWPSYTYIYTGNSDVSVGQSAGQMEMSATFEDETEFVADFNAHLVLQELAMNMTGQSMTLTMSAKDVRFTRHDAPLDVNGDGIPDLLQPQIFSK